jgi:signal transduction histidine kinase
LKRYLIFKLLAINLLIIAFAVIIIWLSIDTLAASYFVTLMEKYNISPKPAHAMFVSAIHRYLIWAALGAVLLAVALSYALTKRALAPLTQMTALSREIAAGNYSARVPVKSTDEVGQLAEAFNRMTESLNTIENLRRTLMIDVAHELRTPLTNIRGYLEALNDGVLPPSKEIFSMLQDETMRLVKLVEDVLRLARADAAHGKLQKTAIDLKGMIREALEPFAGLSAQKNITIKIIPPDSKVRAAVDKKRFVRVLRNLTENAVGYAPENSRINIRIATAAGEIRVAYSNDAPNLKHEDLPYIFERFYRGEKSRSRRHGGAGIGLSIVKELVEAHGGKVSADLRDKKLHIGFSLPIET